MVDLEVLAPAGDLESFKCAIYNGADAVYLGLNNFNARIKAENFTKDNISDIVNFAHVYGVKVYLTINTLIKDEEISEFLSLIKTTISAGVDAYIIQDFGMAKLLKESFDGIILHASTQMGIHNLQGAKNLEKLGFSRVVLSRETRLDDIKLIREKTNLEIEYFVQGALCVSFSGNCYLSEINNGNSGNRGKCLQLCRLPYSIYEKDKFVSKGYYLSPSDLCLISNLETLIDAGVTSFKIEGRLKRASYVAQAVRSYKKAINAITGQEKINIDREKDKIKELFSRGKFNETAYLFDNNNIINPNINNHEGKLIGKVQSITKLRDINKIVLKLVDKIGEGDVLRLVGKNSTVSVGVGNVNVLDNARYEIFSIHLPEIASDVYLLKNNAKEENLTKFERKIPINMELVAKLGKKAVLTAECNGVKASVESSDLLVEAKSKAVTFEDAYKQLNKLNDTNFELEYLNTQLDNVFIAVSSLNELRRQVVSLLQEKIIEKYNESMPKITEKSVSLKPSLETTRTDMIIINSASQVRGRSEGSIIICPEVYDFSYIQNIIDEINMSGKILRKLYLSLPIVATSKEVARIEKILQKLNIGIVINNYSQMHLIGKYKAIAGLGLNIYNSYTAKAWLDMGVENFIYSIEKDIIVSKSAGMVYYKGYPRLMTFCHCPIKAIYGVDCGKCKFSKGLTYEDDKGNRYSLRREKIDNCYFGLYDKKLYERKSGYGKIIDLRD